MNNLDELKKQFLTAIESCTSAKDVEEIRHTFKGRKGLLAEFRKGMDFKSLSPEERSSFGKRFNELKNLMDSKIAEIHKKFTDSSAASKIHKIDMTLPGSDHSIGSIHPISLVQMELEEIFMSMGFVVETGFDVETEFYNFDALNTPFDHPAREMQDTFWLTNGMVLRTQTSAVTVNPVVLVDGRGTINKYNGKCCSC